MTARNSDRYGNRTSIFSDFIRRVPGISHHDIDGSVIGGVVEEGMFVQDQYNKTIKDNIIECFIEATAERIAKWDGETDNNGRRLPTFEQKTYAIQLMARKCTDQPFALYVHHPYEDKDWSSEDLQIALWENLDGKLVRSKEYKLHERYNWDEVEHIITSIHEIMTPAAPIAKKAA